MRSGSGWEHALVFCHHDGIAGAGDGFQSAAIEDLDAATQGIRIVEIIYREQGFFPGRELYFLDPSGNLLELRDPTWQAGMPTPAYEEIARS